MRQPSLSDKMFSQLWRKYHMQGEPHRCFLSIPELKGVLTHDAVWKSLQQQQIYTDDQLAEVVTQVLRFDGPRTSIRILTILNLLGHIRRLRVFLEAEVYDEHLPLIHESPAFNRLLRSGCHDFELNLFCSQQWHVLAPTFELGSDPIQKQHFMQQARMPFLKRELISRGGQGKILKVKIHANHVRANSSASTGLWFAIKQFESHQEDFWNDEVDALTILSRSQYQHKHLIRLLTAYEHKEHGFFLIFPLAECSLSDYWALDLCQPRFAKGPRWLLEQCSGIASGLSRIHSTASENNVTLGRHGDIKPGNILWFKNSNRDRGKLVLADFTSTRFHSSETVNNTSTGTSGITRTYSPPEVSLKPKVRCAQAYDIWSLGCVYLEFLTWYLLGNGAIREESFIHSCGGTCHGFARLRTINDEHHYWDPGDKFFNITQRDGSWVAVVKETVEQWIQMLHRSQWCSQALHEFLELIEKYMLVVEPSNRLKANEVADELTNIFNKALKPDYCRVGYPWAASTTDMCHPPFSEEEQDENSTMRF